MTPRQEVEAFTRSAYAVATSPPMLRRLADFYNWITIGACKIRDTHAELVSLELRPVQYRVLARMMRQAAAGKPIRIIVGKSRKTGISTLIQAMYVFFCSVYPLQKAVTLAQGNKAVKEIFDIAVRVARKWTVRPASEDVGGLTELYWTDHDSKYGSGTAAGTAVGAGGTPSLLHLSEMAKWPSNKKADTEYNATTAVPDNPLTIIVYESTFVGRDLFWTRFDDARNGRTGYEAEFIAWWMDPTLEAEPEPDFERTREEKRLAVLANADGVEMTNEMLAWRRQKIKQIGSVLFRQEYPSTPEEAIQATKGLILPMMRSALVDSFPFAIDRLPPENRIGGIDFGYYHPTVIGSGYRYDGVLWVDQIWWGQETLAEEQVAGLRDATRYSCDPSGVSYRKQLQRAAEVAGVRCSLTAAPRKKASHEKIGTVEMRSLIHAVESGRLKILSSIPAVEQLLIESDTFAWNEKTGEPDHSSATPDACDFDTVYMLKYLVMGGFREPAAPAVRRATVASRGRSFRS